MTSNDLARNLIQRVNVGDSLTRSTARNPEALCVVEGTRRLNYKQFNNNVNQMANALLERSIHLGDAVALASANSIEFLVTYYACAKIGAVCVPINLGWRANEVAHVLNHSGARIFVVQAGLADAMSEPAAAANGIELVIVIDSPASVQEAPAKLAGLDTISFTKFSSHQNSTEPECLVEDRAALTYLYTSGTTALPKGVVGNHIAIYLESMTMVIEGRFQDDDRFAAVMPMFHTAQLNCRCTPAIMVGAAIFILPGFDANTLLDLIEAEGITQIFALPMMYRAMLEHETIERRQLSTLRRALYAMAPMPQDMLRRCMDVFGSNFFLLFGQTEMSPATTIFRPEHQLTHPGAVGTPVINVEARIMDDDGNLLSRGQTGEIVYRGPHAMNEYLRDPAATERAFRNGWFHSGDIGHFDDDNVLWFTDRGKDVIKTGGENVSSLEVEKAVYTSEQDVAEVTVVGLPHEYWIEAITAFVVARPGTRLDAQTIRTEMRNHIDAYKIPKAIVVVDELPKTSTGKIQKHIIREHYMAFYRNTDDAPVPADTAGRDHAGR